MTFTLKANVNGKAVRVVFVHLKSASKKDADEALKIAAKALTSAGAKPEDPILWIGDFNRAGEPPDLAEFSGTLAQLFAGGGQSQWKLDRAYKTGNWGTANPTAKQVAKAATDHDHAAIEVEFDT